MRIPLTLSVDIETKKIVEEMQGRRIVPSRIIDHMFRAFAANGYKLTEDQKPESAI